eukprot:TRINITY_DN17841_c0_g1_i1.p1 TRINITY_DN17841_c0_g1~~TRINITY_DN17841_c0_g1_i1.p1  ORF type:complete len:561 (+),score=55.93 TRINITY_DN17841_c0_g1_i1:54-1736(+)
MLLGGFAAQTAARAAERSLKAKQLQVEAPSPEVTPRRLPKTATSPPSQGGTSLRQSRTPQTSIPSLRQAAALSPQRVSSFVCERTPSPTVPQVNTACQSEIVASEESLAEHGSPSVTTDAATSSQLDHAARREPDPESDPSASSMGDRKCAAMDSTGVCATSATDAEGGEGGRDPSDSVTLALCSTATPPLQESIAPAVRPPAVVAPSSVSNTGINARGVVHVGSTLASGSRPRLRVAARTIPRGRQNAKQSQSQHACSSADGCAVSSGSARAIHSGREDQVAKSSSSRHASSSSDRHAAAPERQPAASSAGCEKKQRRPSPSPGCRAAAARLIQCALSATSQAREIAAQRGGTSDSDMNQVADERAEQSSNRRTPGDVRTPIDSGVRTTTTGHKDPAVTTGLLSRYCELAQPAVNTDEYATVADIDELCRRSDDLLRVVAQQQADSNDDVDRAGSWSRLASRCADYEARLRRIESIVSRRERELLQAPRDRLTPTQPVTRATPTRAPITPRWSAELRLCRMVRAECSVDSASSSSLVRRGVRSRSGGIGSTGANQANSH